MEYLNRKPVTRVNAVLFDFDGTISTLRCGWEEVMAQFASEVLLGCEPDAPERVEALVLSYIDESAGVQTIHQMKWLRDQVALRGGEALDPWAYKDEYNRRLMMRVQEKKRALAAGRASPRDFLIAGAAEFLEALRQSGARVYVASGTDHPDVVAEAKALGVYAFFDELAGAPPREEGCSKQKVLRGLIEGHGLRGSQLAVIGDGKVEIALGKQAGALTLGLASDEQARQGVNPLKRQRLIRAGADVVIGDFLEKREILALLGLA